MPANMDITVSGFRTVDDCFARAVVATNVHAHRCAIAATVAHSGAVFGFAILLSIAKALCFGRFVVSTS